jgi:hypothetical protein
MVARMAESTAHAKAVSTVDCSVANWVGRKADWTAADWDAMMAGRWESRRVDKTAAVKVVLMAHRMADLTAMHLVVDWDGGMAQQKVGWMAVALAEPRVHHWVAQWAECWAHWKAASMGNRRAG